MPGILGWICIIVAVLMLAGVLAPELVLGNFVGFIKYVLNAMSGFGG